MPADPTFTRELIIVSVAPKHVENQKVELALAILPGGKVGLFRRTRIYELS